MLKKLQISNSSCPIFDNPSLNANLETEGLFGEVFVVKKIISHWCFGFLETDSYYGWIQTKYLQNYLNTNYKVVSIRSLVLVKPNVKSKTIFYLPMCSLIKVEKFIGEWAKIHFLKSNILNFGYIPKSHILKNGCKINNWEEIAHRFMYTPYKWGGRDTLSIDCSSLIQLICNTQNIFLPRNTKEQVIYIKSYFEHSIVYPKLSKNVNKTELYKKGSIIYWQGHVGVIINDHKIMHANAFHNNVNVEDVQDTIERLKTQNLDVELICNLFR